MHHKLFVIILNYNGWQDTLDCVQSVQHSNYSDTNIVVVDNASTDGSFDILKQELSSDVILLHSDKNIGYAGGNNIGIRYAVEQGAEYLCILNNDTVIAPDAFTKCIDLLDRDPSIGFTGPLVMEFDRESVQSTGGNIYIQKGNVTLNNNGKRPSELPQEVPCDYIGGACILLRASLLEEIGVIPEAYFLFFEETEWCYRAQLAGYRNVCLTDAQVRHKGSASIDVINGLHAYLMERNRVAFVKRNINSKARYLLYLMYQFVKTVYRALFKNKVYWSYLKYQLDGALQRIDTERFPFIVIKDLP
ncbi:MAG: glycosyltransferase family 2 protein [Oscillospiraceae bacterium]|nr:glycosyltransferase family 2 protein [Oscillospiraceae bacterium]